MKKVLSMLLALMMVVSVVMVAPVNIDTAKAAVEEQNVTVNTYRFSSEGKTKITSGKYNVRWNPTYTTYNFALFEISLPNNLTSIQSLESLSLKFYLSRYDKLHKVYAAGSDAANWTINSDGADIINDGVCLNDSKLVTGSSDATGVNVELTAYANELIASNTYKMYLLLTSAYTLDFTLDKGLPSATAKIKTAESVETEAVKLINSVEPTYDSSASQTNGYCFVNNSNYGNLVLNYISNRKCSANNSGFCVFKIELPAGLQANQTIESCILNYTVSSININALYIAKLTPSEVEAMITANKTAYSTYKDAVVKSDANQLGDLSTRLTWEIREYGTEGEAVCEASLDVTDYANELIASNEYSAEDGIVMYLAYHQTTSTVNIKTGDGYDSGYSIPTTTITVKTTPVIDYASATSLQNVTAGEEYIAITTADNVFATQAGVVLVVAQYKGGELISVSTLTPQAVAGNAEDVLLKTSAITIDDDADTVKAFTWADGEFKPLSANAVATVAEAE